MNEKQNVELVKKAYGAFMRKDYDGIFTIMRNEIEWEAAVGIGKRLPFTGLRKTLPEVKTYFKELEQNLEFKKYDIKEYIAEKDKVVALGRYEAVVKQTHKLVETPFVAVFTLKDEKIVKYEQYIDTAALLQAFQLSVMTA